MSQIAGDGCALTAFFFVLMPALRLASTEPVVASAQ